MHKPTTSRTAAAALVEQLVINGVKHVFCVPGESFLPCWMRFATAASP
jgi:acetolactate synthase-1/2/3 large subunit